MATPFYTYPQSHGGFSIGDRVTYRGGSSVVYTLTGIQIRTSDGHALFMLRSAKTRQSESRIDRLVQSDRA